MGTNNYLWAVLITATLSLAACSSDENEEPKLQGQAKLELTLEGTAMTKATGTLPITTGENNISNVAVAIFNSNGTVNVIQEFTDVSNAVTVNCTQGNGCTGIVVANAPTGTFSGVANKNDFNQKTVKLSQTQSNGDKDIQDAETLPMSGEIKVGNSNSFDLGAAKVSATAALSRLVARVAITNIKTDFDPNGQYSAATFKIKKVFLHNATSVSTVGIGVPTTTNIITGKEDTENKYLQNSLSDVDITSTPHTTPYWFYTFANPKNGTEGKHTKLVIYGTFDADGTGAGASEEDVYYPVVVNKLQPGTTINDGTNIPTATDGKGDMTIERNARYNITATIKGKGVSNPDDDIDPTTLELTVSVAEWTLNISQNVTFN